MTGGDQAGAWQEELYRDLHRHPELSHQEHRTAALVARHARELGLQVHEGVGGTGVVAILHNGDGPTVMLRADMDALPVTERSGLSYASAHDGVMHACGHDVHIACLLGAAAMLAGSRDSWSGTVVALFQPAEETGDGARRMVEDGLVGLVGEVDVVLAQHVMAMPAGVLATRSGPMFSAADNLRITVHGRGGHGSMPQSSVDPVVLAAMIVLRLQTVVSREVAPNEPAVVTVGSLHAGTGSNIIADRAVLELSLRTYTAETRQRVLEAVRRIVTAECAASGSPREAEFEVLSTFPVTVNDDEPTARVRSAFEAVFGDAVADLPLQPASEDFSELPRAFGAAATYWAIGGADPETYRLAEEAGRVAEEIPTNHSPYFAPVMQPTLDTGTRALVTAALAWLA